MEISKSSEVQYDANRYEILIGDVGFAESDKVISSIGYGDSAARFEGNKLVVVSADVSLLDNALFSVLQGMKRSLKNGEIKLAADFSHNEAGNESIKLIPKFDEAGAPSFVWNTGTETMLLNFTDTTVEQYKSYMKKIASSGYELYTTNTIRDNEFTTFINDEYLIHASYYAYTNETRVTIEEKRGLATREADNVYTKNENVVSSLAQIGLEPIGNGMSYAIQLADGSFIVIDGSYTEYGERLWNYMKAKAPNGEVKIAAWILTHPHSDHHQTFLSDFCSKYEVKAEKVIFNFAEMHGTDNNLCLDVISRMEGCEYIKAHPGQKFYIRNAVVEILYSLDSWWPLVYGDIVNESSLVFTVDIEGERMMFTADASDTTDKICNAMYGDYLKSDMLQAEHHGAQNHYGSAAPNVIAFYRNVGAEITLVPSAMRPWLFGNGQTQMSYASVEAAREVYVAGHAITVLELPYNIYSAYYFNPDGTQEPVNADKPSSTEKIDFKDTLGTTVPGVSWNIN